MQDILKAQTDADVIVFAVWEPILPTDWSSPGTGVLSRLSDRRARQYWDSTHRIAEALQQSGVKPPCCERKGILWDLAAVYPPGLRWEKTLPAPSFVSGPVVKVTESLRTAIPPGTP